MRPALHCMYDRMRAKLISFKLFDSIMDIIENDLRRLDLNLLLTFRALLEERSVTRAAQRLFLGQPAVSGALKRLRAAFGDELFVRTPHGIEPTPRAFELARQIEPLLVSLHRTLTQPPVFDPSSAQRVFRVGLTDALEVALMPEIMSRVARSAPGVKLIMRTAEASSAPGMLDEGVIELAVGVFRECAAWHRREPLFRWRFVCVYNPRLVAVRGKALSMDEFLQHRHLLTSFNAGLHGYIDEQLEVRNQRRQVVFSSPNFATSPFIVQRTPAITTVPDFIAGAWRDTLGLAVSPLPLEVPSYEVSLLWTASNAQDPGIAWLASEFAAAFGTAGRH